MKIAIIGTRGIPNRYGGFEQCAQEIAPRFVAAGHRVTVFNPASHDYTEPTYRGVDIERIAWDEQRLGPLGLFSFEWLALAGARRAGVDVALVLGHTPSGLFLTPPRGRRYAVVTNVDGVERWRAKFGWIKRQVLIAGEARAVRRSDLLVADNRGIATYLLDHFGAGSECIEYGATIPPEIPDLPSAMNLAPGHFDLVIARLEPENNVAMIVEGAIAAQSNIPMIVVGGLTTPHARVLLRRYAAQSQVRFVGGIYEPDTLNAMRHHARIYYHGHSVGGTNPALLEAMAAGARIAAHDNIFNRDVLGASAAYFASSTDVAITSQAGEPWPVTWQQANLDKVRDVYNWDRIAVLYLKAFDAAVARHAQHGNGRAR